MILYKFGSTLSKNTTIYWISHVFLRISLKSEISKVVLKLTLIYGSAKTNCKPKPFFSLTWVESLSQLMHKIRYFESYLQRSQNHIILLISVKIQKNTIKSSPYPLLFEKFCHRVRCAKSAFFIDLGSNW